jgi:single-strand DNA-binding protein
MGINKVHLIGNLGSDPELRTASTPVCRFRLATSQKHRDKSGNVVEHTEWHTIVAFGATAENCARFLRKGRQAYVEGRIHTRKYQDQEGKERILTEIVAGSVEFLGSKGEAGQAAEAEKPLEFPPVSIEEIGFDDDDIPF